MDITANGAAQQRHPPPLDAFEQKLPRTAGMLQTTGQETERRGDRTCGAMHRQREPHPSTPARHSRLEKESHTVRAQSGPSARQTVWTGCAGTARLLVVLATTLLLSLLPQKQEKKGAAEKAPLLLMKEERKIRLHHHRHHGEGKKKKS